MPRFTFALLCLTVGGAAHAQRPLVPSSSPARAPQVAHAADPAPAPPPTNRPVYQQPVYVVDGSYGYIITGAPYLVLSDGSVLVNFGNGYERVLRPCAVRQQSQPVSTNGRDALGRIGPPPGIAALNAGTRGQLGGTMPRQNVAACYRVNARGGADVIPQ